MKLTDYLVMRTPPARMGDEVPPVPPAPEPGTVSTPRIVMSLVGMILGIVASFFIIGLGSMRANSAAQQPAQQTSTVQQSTAPAPNPAPPSLPRVQSFTWSHFWLVCLLALVICGLSYQGLYFSLRLYQSQPTFLILFVSFQYGYFWQSAVNALVK